MADDQKARLKAENKRRLQEHLERLQKYGGKPPPEEAAPTAGSSEPKPAPKPPPRPAGWEAWKRLHGNRTHTIRSDVDQAKLASEADFRILEIKPGASKDEVKRAFNRLAKEHHPDVGGDAEIFQAMLGAYQRLTK